MSIEDNCSTMPLRFRVWDNKDRRFYTLGDLMQSLSEPARSCTHFTLAELFALQKHFSKVLLISTRFAISQDTGLKDKNGKSIFTGDIISDIDDGYLSVIKYISGECVGVDPVTNETIDCLYLIGRDGEVIGSIWENPELLEEEE